MAMMLMALFITSIGSVQSGSRLTWSFARDDAIIFSAYVKKTHDRLGVPGWALLFNGFWLAVLGCVHLISSSGLFLMTKPQDYSLLTLPSIQRLHWNSHADRVDLIQLPCRLTNVAMARSKIFANQQPFLFRQIRVAGQRNCCGLDSFCPGCL